MSSQYAIIYFIHDDIKSEFEDILNLNILKATIPPTISAYVIFNKRIAHRTTVSYITQISQLISKPGKPTRLQPLGARLIWQEAFNFVRNHLQQNEFTGKIGLIVLSHAAGIVINVNNEEKRIIRFLNKNRDFLIRLRDRFSPDDAVYLRSRKNRGLLIVTKTIIDTTVPLHNNKPGFTKAYVRKRGIPYCKKYEGLFTFQLSQFFQEENWSFEFIIFSNCNILVYDTGFLFAPFTPFIIGAQTLSIMSTWDFSIIIKTIQDNLNNPTQAMLMKLFKGCIENFFQTSDERTLRYFLLSTANFNTLHDTFEEIIRAIIGNLEEAIFREGILDWVSTAETTDDTLRLPLIDTLAFFNFANSIANQPFTNTLTHFQLQLAQMILSRNSEEPGFCGYSLYLPKTKKEFNAIRGGQCNYFDPANRNSFSTHSRFDDLLLSLYR